MKLIRCYRVDCHDYSHKLLIKSVANSISRIDDLRSRRLEPSHIKVYVALCRAHLKEMNSYKGLYTEWKGKLFKPVDGGEHCTHSKCRYAATSFFWRTSDLSDEAITYIASGNSLGRGLGFRRKGASDERVSLCQFHADAALDNYGERPGYTQIPMEVYQRLFVESILDT